MSRAPTGRILGSMRRLIPIVALIAAVAALRFLPVEGVIEELQRLTREAGIGGYVVYALGYGLIALFFPASLLTIAGGAIFGVLAGSIVVAAGATLASALAFLIARTIGRRRLQRLIDADPRYRAVDRAIEKEGARIVFLVRLAAVFPFTLMNYLFGLTSVRFLPYLAATAVGILPGTLAFVTIGATGAAAAAQDTTRLVFTIGGLVVAFAVSVFVGRIATRAIRQAGVEAGPDPLAHDPATPRDQ